MSREITTKWNINYSNWELHTLGAVWVEITIKVNFLTKAYQWTAMIKDVEGPFFQQRSGIQYCFYVTSTSVNDQGLSISHRKPCVPTMRCVGNIWQQRVVNWVHLSIYCKISYLTYPVKWTEYAEEPSLLMFAIFNELNFCMGLFLINFSIKKCLQLGDLLFLFPGILLKSAQN